MILAHRSFNRWGKRWLAIAREASYQGQRAVEVEVAPWTQEYAAKITAQEDREMEAREADEARKRQEAHVVIMARIESIGKEIGNFAAQRTLGFDPRAEAAERETLAEIGKRNDKWGVPLYG